MGDSGDGAINVSWAVPNGNNMRAHIISGLTRQDIFKINDYPFLRNEILTQNGLNFKFKSRVGVF